jgi:hypothetical protein
VLNGTVAGCVWPVQSVARARRRGRGTLGDRGDLPRADRQHCAVHRLRSLQAKLPKSEHVRVGFNYWSAFTDVDSQHLYRIKYQQTDADTLDEEVTAA